MTNYKTCKQCDKYNYSLKRCQLGFLNVQNKTRIKCALQTIGIDYICNYNKFKNAAINEDILKAYFKLFKDMMKEKQFNKKIEMHKSLLNIENRNSLTKKDYNEIINIYKDGKKIAYISKTYSSKKVNLTYKHLEYKLTIL